jgi:hypothetical protein
MIWKKFKTDYIVRAAAAIVLIASSVLWSNASLAAANGVPLDIELQAQTQPEKSPAICGTYTFMEADLYSQGFRVIGAGVVNGEGDRWVLFEQVVGIEPLKWVMLIYVNAEYNGLLPGAACEIIVGIDWQRFSPGNPE